MTDPAGARKLGHASTGLSSAGIIVTVLAIVIVVVIAVVAVADYDDDSCTYTYYGECYRYKEYVGSHGSCSGLRIGSYCYHN